MTVLGVFGGASLNSVELALVKTDGIDINEIIKTAVVPYPEPLAMEMPVRPKANPPYGSA